MDSRRPMAMLCETGLGIRPWLIMTLPKLPLSSQTGSPPSVLPILDALSEEHGELRREVLCELKMH